MIAHSISLRSLSQNLLLANWLRSLFGFLHPHTLAKLCSVFKVLAPSELTDSFYILSDVFVLCQELFSSLCRLAFNLTTVKYITCTLLFRQIFLLVRFLQIVNSILLNINIVFILISIKNLFFLVYYINYTNIN